MDNQKHKKLELLCSYLVNHPISHIDLICQDLDLSIENLTALISELQGMGLEISIDLKNIQLNKKL